MSEFNFLLFTCRFLAATADVVESDEEEFGGEYCLSESFNASCPGADEVIVMTVAEYGRMRSGRCIQMKYGQPGCRADVISRLDAHCSGRPACSFPVARLLQASISPCDDELKSYLYASYRCVTGEVDTSIHNSAIYWSIRLLSLPPSLPLS